MISLKKYLDSTQGDKARREQPAEKGQLTAVFDAYGDALLEMVAAA